MKITPIELVWVGIMLITSDLIYLYINPSTSINMSDKIFGEVVALATLYILKSIQFDLKIDLFTSSNFYIRIILGGNKYEK